GVLSAAVGWFDGRASSRESRGFNCDDARAPVGIVAGWAVLRSVSDARRTAWPGLRLDVGRLRICFGQSLLKLAARGAGEQRRARLRRLTQCCRTRRGAHQV